MLKPNANEYPAYFQSYIDRVGDNFLENFQSHSQSFPVFLQNELFSKSDYRYAKDKWNVKELIMHIIDVERVMFYRALVASRDDEKTIVYSMDDKLYAKNSGVEHLSFNEVLETFIVTRAATLQFFKCLSDEQSIRFVQGNVGRFSARSLGYIILGHCLHHEQILRERYL